MAYAGFPPPEPFSFVNADWILWNRRFERFRAASKRKDDTDEDQINTLIYCMGPRAEKVYESLNMPANSSYEEVKKKMTEHFSAGRNSTDELETLITCKQKEQSVTRFYEELTVAAGKATLNALKPDDVVRELFIIGLTNKKISDHLRYQVKEKLTLEKALTIAQGMEKRVEKANGAVSEASELDAVQKVRGGARQRQPASDGKEKCGKCGYREHRGPTCPALEQECFKCHNKGHFTQMCKSNRQKISEVERVTSTDGDGGGAVFLGEISVDLLINADGDHPPRFAHLAIGNTAVKFKVDTGADVTCLDIKSYDALSPKPPLTECRARLRSPGGDLRVFGEFWTRVRFRQHDYQIRVVVVAAGGSNLLSRSAAIEMNIVSYNLDEAKEESILAEFEDCFGESGLLKMDPIRLELKNEVHPVAISTARNIPFPQLNTVKEELERMEKLGVIRRVTEPTEWCSGMVVVPKKTSKNGKREVRICVDFKALNSCLRRRRFYLETLEDIAPRLASSKFFTTLDAVSGFWQKPLHVDSQLLTTFITPFGRFCFTRFPFGITDGSEIFQEVMKTMFRELPGVEVIIDDILIHAATRVEHDRRLRAVLTRIRASGLKLNRKKVKYAQPEVEYFGHYISREGYRPHPEKIKDLLAMKPPTNVSELRAVMGMFNYHTKFYPQLATELRPISELLSEKNAFLWDDAQQRAFRRVKELMTTPSILAYYDPSLPTAVNADSSAYGLGATLLQRHELCWRPVAYASRVLTQTERRYAQIEKECLAAVWACEKFERYLLGLPQFHLRTDHKPLVPLMTTKSLADAPIRCQRMLLRLMRYNAVISHISGKDMIMADALSRAPNPDSNADSDMELATEEYMEAVEESLPCSRSFLRRLVEESMADGTISRAMQMTRDGFPKKSKHVEDELSVLIANKQELSAARDVLWFRQRLVIPVSMRLEVLERLHMGHLGIEKCLRRAETCVWWPGIRKSVEKFIDGCNFCLENRPAQRHEPLRPVEVPGGPWRKIAMDFGVDHLKRKFIVVVDYYSKWLEIEYMNTTTAEALIKVMSKMFAVHGYPEEIVSDQGPPFTGELWKRFLKERDVRQRFSSPTFAQSNGAAESAVKVAKRILRQDDPSRALLAYRCTSHSATDWAPSQLLCGRLLRSELPIPEHRLKQSIVDPTAAQRRAKQLAKKYYDKHNGVRELPPLEVGDRVRLRDSDGQWTIRGEITAQRDERSYQVTTAGAALERNRFHIREDHTAEKTSDSEAEGDSFYSVSGESGDASDELDEPTMTEEPSEPERQQRQRKEPFWLKDFVK